MFASTLVACSSALIEYSVNSRGYEIQTFLLVSIFGLGQYLLHHAKNQAGWILWVILSALAFWTLPTTFYAYGGITIWFLGSLALKPSKLMNSSDRSVPLNPFSVSPLENREIAKTKILKSFIVYTTCAAVFVLILYSPILIVFRIGHMNTMLTSGNFGFEQITSLIPDLWDTWLRNFPDPLRWMFIVPLLFGFIPLKDSKFKLSPFLCCLVWLLLIVSITSAYGLSSLFSRIWLPYSVFFYITLSVGTSHLIDWLQRLLEGSSRYFHLPTKMAILMCVLALFVGTNEEIRNRYIYHVAGSFHDAKMVTQYFQNNLQTGDLIMAPCPYGMPLLYEFSRQNTPFSYASLCDEMGAPQQVYLYGTAKKIKPKKADLYLIEDTSKKLNDILKQAHFEGWLMQPIEKIACFEKTTLYRIHLEEIDVH